MMAVRQHIFMVRIHANIDSLIVQQFMLITAFEDAQVMTRWTVVSQYQLDKRIEKLRRSERDLLKRLLDNRREQFRMLMSPSLDALLALPDADAEIVLQHTMFFADPHESSTPPQQPNLKIVQ